MKRYEYLTTFFAVDAEGVKHAPTHVLKDSESDKPKSVRVDEDLDALGLSGWRLVSAHFEQVQHGHVLGLRALGVFIREAKSEAAG